MDNVAFDMGLRLERNAHTPDRADHPSAHDDVFGDDAAHNLCCVAEQERAAMNVALDISPSTWISPLEATLPVIVRPIIEGIILLPALAAQPLPIFVTLSPASGFFVNINGYLPFPPC